MTDSALLDHIAAKAPAGHLVGVGLRVLREPSTPTGGDYRSMRSFCWIPASELSTVHNEWARYCTSEHLAEWEGFTRLYGGPERAARLRHLHGTVWAGCPMVRLVTVTEVPRDERGVARGGRFDELRTVIGVSLDVDVAECRPGDHRRYCPTLVEAVRFLDRYAPSVVLDAGGGVVGVWLFDEPAEPGPARRLGLDLFDAFAYLCQARGWKFDSPPPVSAWLKVPGCRDLFRDHTVTEIAVDAPWPFAKLRALVRASSRRSRRAAAKEYGR